MVAAQFALTVLEAQFAQFLLFFIEKRKKFFLGFLSQFFNGYNGHSGGLVMQTGDEFAAGAQFAAGQADGFAGSRLGNPVDFENYTAGVGHGHEMVNVSLSLTHRHFGAFFGDRPVRENPDPDFPFALDETGHGAPGGLQLAGRNPRRLEHFEPVFAKTQLVAPLGGAAQGRRMLFAVFDFLG